jgi:hypothetical protein
MKHIWVEHAEQCSALRELVRIAMHDFFPLDKFPIPADYYPTAVAENQPPEPKTA